MGPRNKKEEIIHGEKDSYKKKPKINHLQKVSKKPSHLVKQEKRRGWGIIK